MLLWAHHAEMGCQPSFRGEQGGKRTNFPGRGHNGGFLPSQGAARSGNLQGNPRAQGPCSSQADETLCRDCVWWGRLADGMWSNGLIRQMVRPLSPHSRWARTLPASLPISSTWDITPAIRTCPGAPAAPCPPPPTWEPPPTSRVRLHLLWERFPGHLLGEDLEPPHREFWSQRPKDQGAANCGPLLFPACSSPPVRPSGSSLGSPRSSKTTGWGPGAGE